MAAQARQPVSHERACLRGGERRQRPWPEARRRLRAGDARARDTASDEQHDTSAVRASGRHKGYNLNRPSQERSEEHTSELQSPCNLVCRLLLEKKKNRAAPRCALENLRRDTIPST